VVAREVKMAKDMGTLIEKAREELSKLTGLKAGSTVEVTKDEKEWHITVELLEKRSIPDQMDILALYEAILDDEGNLLSFRRKAMRKRLETEVKE
jgi:hypothetical protein